MKKVEAVQTHTYEKKNGDNAVRLVIKIDEVVPKVTILIQSTEVMTALSRVIILGEASAVIAKDTYLPKKIKLRVLRHIGKDISEFTNDWATGFDDD